MEGMQASILPSYELDLSFIVFSGADHSYRVSRDFPDSFRVNVFVPRIKPRTFLPDL
jgi:hypothetical protein